MNHKARLFPLSSNSLSRKFKTQRRPVARFEDFIKSPLYNTEIRDMKLLRSWLAYDSVLEADLAPRRVNWNAVLGLGLATLVSMGIWAGVGLVFVQILK